MKYVNHKEGRGENFIQHTLYFAIEENKLDHALKY